jgi:hypothetical protein
MLQYGERVLTLGMDLVRQVEPDDDVAALAMTATGSFLELGRPNAEGMRRFVYRASVRPGGERDSGEVELDDKLLLGNPVFLGQRRTSELLIIAAGPNEPPDDDTIPGGMLLFGPLEDELYPHKDDLVRIGLTRFRVLIDMAENCTGPMRTMLHERASLLAAELQSQIDGEGGYLLEELQWFETSSGSRYDVMQHGDMDLVRHGADGSAVLFFHLPDIGPQLVTAGAPLVVFYSGVRAAKQVAFMFRIAKMQPIEGDVITM